MAWTPISPWKLAPGTAQKVAYTATAANATAVGAQTRAVLIAVTTDAHIRITAAAQAAVVADMIVKAAWGPIVLGINPGDTVSVVEDNAAGSLYLQELTH